MDDKIVKLAKKSGFVVWANGKIDWDNNDYGSCLEKFYSLTKTPLEHTVTQAYWLLEAGDRIGALKELAKYAQQKNAKDPHWTDKSC